VISFFQPRFFVEVPRPREGEALVAIHASSFPHPWSADDFRALVSDRSVFVLGVRRVSFFGARRLVGFVLVREAGGEAEILTVAVLPEERGRGLGRLLMEEALRRLYRDHVAVCFLEVAEDNKTAIALYASLGFVTVGTRKGYYRRAGGREGGALVMRLQVR